MHHALIRLDYALALFRDRAVHRSLRHLTPTSLIKKACSRPCVAAMLHQAKALSKSAGQAGIWNLVLPLHNGAQMGGAMLFCIFLSKIMNQALGPPSVVYICSTLKSPWLEFLPCWNSARDKHLLGLILAETIVSVLVCLLAKYLSHVSEYSMVCIQSP